MEISLLLVTLLMIIKYIDTHTSNSSASALREHFSPEQIKQGTMHQTNKAFERYFRVAGAVILK